MVRLRSPQVWRIVNDAARAVFGTDEKGRQKKHVGPHAFRHLRAQDLADEGMDLPVLQDYLGHTSPVTTRQSYAPKTPSKKLLDQVATYGRQADEVIARGEQAIED